MNPAPFTALARVYDAIMQDVPYEEWLAFVLRRVTERGWRGGRVLDVGCGTGNASLPLLERGFEVVGLDASEAMLAMARRKLPQGVWLRGDVRDASLPGPFSLAVSVFDTMNNLLEEADMLAALRHLHAHLSPGGQLAFDVNTTVGLTSLWEGDVAEGWAGDVHYRWEHSWDQQRRLASVEAWCSTPKESFVEVHHERPYDPEQIARLLAQAGFEAVEVVTFPEGEPADELDPRVWAFAQRPWGEAPAVDPGGEGPPG